MAVRRTPSLCGSFLTDKRSMVAFTWTITTVLTLFAFVTAVVLTVQVHTHYASLKRYYQGDDWYVDDDGAYNYNNNGNGEGQEGGEDQEHNNERNEEYQNAIRESYLQLASMNGTRSITFVAVYCMLLATGLCLYGSMAIVGFTSLRGVYISPCFDNHTSGDKMKVGMFGGAIVLFANLLLVCAVVLGEVRVADYRDDRPEEEQEGNGDQQKEPYQVERIATILAVTCMFLSALYTIFAVLLFLCHAGEEKAILRLEETDGTIGMVGVGSTSKSTPLVGMGVSDHGILSSHHDPHRPAPLVNSSGFITMENSSQGTSE